jgi:8-oxo-dGTP diphosphatase
MSWRPSIKLVRWPGSGRPTTSSGASHRRNHRSTLSPTSCCNDRADGAVLLVHHRKAELWLPTGGHVDIGEDPIETVRRETFEELGVPAVFADPSARPLFTTVTETNGGPKSRHTDVSLWYLLDGAQSDVLHPDEREFAAAQWWTRAEVDAADPEILEPHLVRFLTKVDAAR